MSHDKKVSKKYLDTQFQTSYSFIPPYPPFPIPGVTNNNTNTWINKGREYKKKYPNNIQNLENTFPLN